VGELRAYALAVTELRDVVGATGARADHLRTLAHQAFAAQTRPLAVPDLLGPLYRRVPGQPVLRADDPVTDDLDVLLGGHPVPPARAAATWRLVEAMVAGLAWSSTVAATDELPTALLAPVGLTVPAVDGLTVGWCPIERAAVVPGLRRWLAGSPDWSAAAVRLGRPSPDVVVLGLP
jgi:hypothetical protein